MDTLQIAYKILYALEHKENPQYMGQAISPERVGAEPGKWLEVVQSLLEEGYVSGVSISEDIVGNQLVDVENARITLKGAEYLRDNSAMRRFAQIATGIIEIVRP